MITASHNPAEYQRIQALRRKRGSISYEKGLDKIKEIVLAMNDIDDKFSDSTGQARAHRRVYRVPRSTC